MSVVVQIGFASSLGSIKFDRIGPDEGLVQQSLTAIFQDRQGFMWFGTQAGLLKFDGYRSKTFRSDPRDPTTLIDNFVSAIYQHRDGGMWIGTQSGLSFYDRDAGTFTNYLRTGAKLGLTGNYKVFAIISDGADGLWLATDYGLMHFDLKTHQFKDYRHQKDQADSLRDDLITDMVQDSGKRLWIGTPIGLDMFDPKEGKFTHKNIDIPGRPKSSQDSIGTLSLGADGTLWLGTDDGLSAVNIHDTKFQARAVADEQGIKAARVQTLFEDRHGSLWIGTVNSGLIKHNVKSGSYETYLHRPLDSNSLLHNHVSKIFEDRTGVLWVGAKSAGLSKVDLASGGFQRYVHLQNDATGLSDNRVRAIAAAGKDSLWLGTYAGGLLKINLRTRQVEAWKKDWKNKFSLRENQIAGLLATKDDKLWIATRSGLAFFDPQKNLFSSIPINTDANDNYIEKVLIDHTGAMWVSSRGGLHRRLANQKNFTTFRHEANNPHSVTNNWAMGLLEDREGTMWVGTMNGLDRFDRESGGFVHFRHTDADTTSISHNRIHALFEDSSGTIWVGTSGGLNRMEKGKDGGIRFRFFATQKNGTAESVGGILEDKAGNIWISSTAGISRLDTKTGVFKNFTGKDGMISGSYLIGAALLSEDGLMNFGGWNGLTRFRPEEVHENRVPPKIVLTDFLISNQPISELVENGVRRFPKTISELKEIHLTHLDNIITLEFSALHYADPMENRYAYRLEGFQDNWVETDAKKRSATYTNLDSGTYFFHVKASNKNGIWNDEGITLAVHISPPFWKTWWFRSLLLLSIFIVIFAFFRFRVRLLLRQKRTLEEQVSLRTIELEGQKSAIESQKEKIEQAHKNISLLSEVGKEITSNLESATIVQILYRHVHELMDATVFGVGFHTPGSDVIEYPFGMEDGKRYGFYTRDFNKKNQLPVCCIENQKSILINDLDNEYQQYIEDLELTTGNESLGLLADGTVAKAPLSLMYVPIFVKNQIRGVISVHSYQKNAYSQTDLDILGTLASYVGVAIDNADAYTQLQTAQDQLVEREKLAALGSLVAGVAHELNTPLGNSLLIASSLEDNIQDFAGQVEAGLLKRSDLKTFVNHALDASVLLMRNLKTSANLVSSFKQVAVDQTSAQRRDFNLCVTTKEVVATMMNQVRQANHELLIDMPHDIQMSSYPGPLGQVLVNFLQNAMLHAFEGRQGGVMRITAKAHGNDRVQIRFEDNGTGISEDNIGRIFEPFFTTKLGHGGSGLGLNVTYNIVSSLLGGHIRVESVVDEGTSFILDLPLTAPEEKSDS
ncbi:MAG: GAF domain-containing protein [Undibacterium sp.]|nr:GAF domain-containing protein [Undibacterium sp.]